MMPTQGSLEQILAKAMTNQALAQRLDMIAANRRSIDKKATDAYLAEAANRLRWNDVYDKHR